MKTQALPGHHGINALEQALQQFDAAHDSLLGLGNLSESLFNFTTVAREDDGAVPTHSGTPWGVKASQGQRPNMEDAYSVQMPPPAHGLLGSVQASPPLAAPSPQHQDAPAALADAASQPVAQELIPVPLIPEDLAVLSVFDGHGGTEVAEHCRDRLHRHFAASLSQQRSTAASCQAKGSGETESDGSQSETPCCAENPTTLAAMRNLDRNHPSCATQHVTEALRTAFHKTDTELAGTDAGEFVGATAVVAVVGRQHIWVAHCGDSRAVIQRNGEAEALTRDHKPDREDEAARIKAAGGRIVFTSGSHRVMGMLAMSRAIGDHFLRPYVIAEPEVSCVERTLQDEVLVLATDGLWDVFSCKEATVLAQRCISRSKERGMSRHGACRVAASVLTKVALERGSRDNITVIVVDVSVPLITPGQAHGPQAHSAPIASGTQQAHAPAAAAGASTTGGAGGSGGGSAMASGRKQVTAAAAEVAAAVPAGPVGQPPRPPVSSAGPVPPSGGGAGPAGSGGEEQHSEVAGPAVTDGEVAVSTSGKQQLRKEPTPAGVSGGISYAGKASSARLQSDVSGGGMQRQGVEDGNGSGAVGVELGAQQRSGGQDGESSSGGHGGAVAGGSAGSKGTQGMGPRTQSFSVTTCTWVKSGSAAQGIQANKHSSGVFHTHHSTDSDRGIDRQLSAPSIRQEGGTPPPESSTQPPTPSGVGHAAGEGTKVSGGGESGGSSDRSSGGVGTSVPSQPLQSQPQLSGQQSPRSPKLSNNSLPHRLAHGSSGTPQPSALIRALQAEQQQQNSRLPPVAPSSGTRAGPSVDVEGLLAGAAGRNGSENGAHSAVAASRRGRVAVKRPPSGGPMAGLPGAAAAAIALVDGEVLAGKVGGLDGQVMPGGPLGMATVASDVEGCARAFNTM